MISSEARYESGFGESQRLLYEGLLKEREVAKEYFMNWDEETSAHDLEDYTEYLEKLSAFLHAMEDLYEISNQKEA